MMRHITIDDPHFTYMCSIYIHVTLPAGSLKIEETSARSVYTCVQLQTNIGQEQWYVLLLDNEIHINHLKVKGKAFSREPPRYEAGWRGQNCSKTP